MSGATFTAPASIALQASASDSDGTVARVDFYAGATLLGSDTTSPYAYTWSGVAAGTYTVAAVATDNVSQSTRSVGRSVTVQAAVGGETVLLADSFTDNVLSPTTWSVASLFSGTEDPSIAVTETGQQLRIGPLLASTSGSHYNGVASVAAYDVTGAAASVELVQPASTGATAYSMFTAGIDSSNYYRIFVTGATLVAQQRIAGVKTDVSLPYERRSASLPAPATRWAVAGGRQSIGS